MTASNANRNAIADRNSIRLGRIVVFGAAILEAIAIGVALFTRHGHGLK